MSSLREDRTFNYFNLEFYLTLTSARYKVTRPKFIVKNNYLPAPYEDWETFQPPLYYLINSYIAPGSLREGNEESHANLVRFISIIYGALALLLIAGLLDDLKIDPLKQFLALLFLSTTPKFVLIFSTYNNDSLATLLCIGILTVSYKLYNKWSKHLSLILFILAVSAIYTKYSAIPCILAIIIICSKNILKLKPPNEVQRKIIITLTLALLSLLPWLIFHNYKYTNKLFPHNANYAIPKELTLEKRITNLSSVLKFPLLQKEEWEHPWLSTTEEEKDTRKELKKHDYLAYSFISSVISHFVADTPSESFVWSMLLIHFYVIIICLFSMPKLNIGKLTFTLILLSYFFQLCHSSQFVPAHIPGTLDFRYISWSYLGWVVLYSVSLAEKSFFAKLQKYLLIAGVLMHIYFLCTVAGGVSKF